MKLLRLPEVMNMTGLSRATLYRRIQEGTFPRSVSLGGRSVAWVDEEVCCWMQDRIDERGLPDNS